MLLATKFISLPPAKILKKVGRLTTKTHYQKMVPITFEISNPFKPKKIRKKETPITGNQNNRGDN